MEKDINEKITLLNTRGIAIIFVVTGNNSSGKTVLTRLLIQKLNFYQSVNLGLASKLIRVLRPDLKFSELENFAGSSVEIFKEIINAIINFYQNTGVNLIIDGVQVDTRGLSNNDSILGGVILNVNESVAIQRGQYPETHFNRKIKKLKNIKYFHGSKFLALSNNYALNETYKAVLKHIGFLLDERLSSYEKRRFN